MILYLTYNDEPGGVYRGQVVDVVAHLATLHDAPVKLVAFVSLRGFRATRRRLRNMSPGAWVLPMVPTMKRWRWNLPLLAWVCRFLRPSGIICRGPFATWMALRMRDRGLTKKVCFDGRGAYAAEWEEYRLIDDDALIAQLRPLEAEAVRNSDVRIAVSQALVAHWQERYGYQGSAHVVIPCTLSKVVRVTDVPDAAPKADARVRLVYSGSVAGWQSFGLLEDLLVRLLDQRPEVDVLFLSRPDDHIAALQQRYPGRVEARWLEPAAVQATLAACDHGIMLREDTITNRVASPTKFAEYLASGLRVITGPGLGDLSALVAEEDLGVVVDPQGALPVLRPVAPAERARLVRFADAHFTKPAHDASYRRVLEALRPAATR